MNESPDSHDIDRLLDLLADQRLSESDERELQSLLETDSSARRRYLEYTGMCAQVAWTLGDPAPNQVTLPTERLTPAQSETEPRWRVIPFLYGITAATLLFVVIGAWAQFGGSQPVAKVDSPVVDADGESGVVATLTGMVDCEWGNAAQPPQYGDQLSAGRKLDLESGVAQVTFENGAQIILQGPVEFVVDSEMKASLDLGKLAAVVPEPAHGFTVMTPTTQIVDLGTEFGVDVDASGETEVHVFDGEVLSWPLDATGEPSGEGISLIANQGAAYERDLSPRKVRAKPAKFVREVEPRIDPSRLPRLPVRSDLVMWLAADVLVKQDSDGRVIAWQDILAGDNQVADDASQPAYEEARPLWVDDAIGGMPALRFHDHTYLVTAPFTTTPQQTVFLVFQRSPAPSDDWPLLRTIINYNGPPSSLKNPSKPFRILQVGDFSESGVYRAFVYAGLGNVATNLAEVSARDETPAYKPIVFSYVYDPESRYSEMWINDVTQGVSEAPATESYLSRKIIGRHPDFTRRGSVFSGDIAEIIIYNGALTRDETARVNAYLLSKYSI